MNTEIVLKMQEKVRYLALPIEMFTDKYVEFWEGLFLKGNVSKTLQILLSRACGIPLNQVDDYLTPNKSKKKIPERENVDRMFYYIFI